MYFPCFQVYLIYLVYYFPLIDAYPGADTPRADTPLSRHPPEQTPPADPPREQTPPREADSTIRSMSGRCASYWNAFLLVLFLQKFILFYIFLKFTKTLKKHVFRNQLQMNFKLNFILSSLKFHLNLIYMLDLSVCMRPTRSFCRQFRFTALLR